MRRATSPHHAEAKRGESPTPASKRPMALNLDKKSAYNPKNPHCIQQRPPYRRYAQGRVYARAPYDGPIWFLKLRQYFCFAGRRLKATSLESSSTRGGSEVNHDTAPEGYVRTGYCFSNITCLRNFEMSMAGKIILMPSDSAVC